MKRKLSIIILIISTVTVISAQDMVDPNRPGTLLNNNPGFITINELHFGIGLGTTNVPYSKSFFGFTTINGYQINKNFVAAAGTGLSFYNGGMLVPLFLDFRFRFNISQFTPYLFGDGGFLLNPSDLNSTKLFINPGLGIRYSFSKNLAANLGGGFLIQTGGSTRDTFINIKMGVTYKF
jgi:hypothetical protein